MNPENPRPLARPCGPWLILALAIFVAVAPAVLFFDLAGSSPRSPLGIYRLHSDDWAYLAASRTLPRTLANLFVPHNTHVVPTWRLLTWAVSATSGRLANLPDALAVVAYATLLATMALNGRLVARETGRSSAGWASAVATGATSLMLSPATWYSAGQTLWAALGIVATLLFLQGWRRDPKAWKLLLAAVAAVAAGGFWTIGHLAGPLGAIYLWADGGPRARKAAAIPLVATLLAVAIGMALGAHKIDSTISFHGRTTREAIHPGMGVSHTFQSIPEHLVLGNLGFRGETTPVQGAALTLAILAAWLGSLKRDDRRPRPLELAGGGLLVAGYLIEWTVRGYLPFSSLRGVVPWYDAIPHVGLVLFLGSWWGGERDQPPTPITRRAGLAVVALALALVILNRPRVDDQWRDRDGADPLAPIAVQNRNAARLARSLADRQRRFLANLDQAEAVARSRGIGLAAVRETFGRLDAPGLPQVYDAADLLDLPPLGPFSDPSRVRAALAPFLDLPPDPRP